MKPRRLKSHARCFNAGNPRNALAWLHKQSPPARTNLKIGLQISSVESDERALILVQLLDYRDMKPAPISQFDEAPALAIALDGSRYEV